MNNLFPYSTMKTMPTSNVTPPLYSSLYSNETSLLHKSALNNINPSFMATSNGLSSQQSNSFNPAAAAAAFALYGILPSHLMFPSNDGQTCQPNSFNLFTSSSPRASTDIFRNTSATESSIDHSKLGKSGQSMFSAFSSPAPSSFSDMNIIQK